MQPVKQWRVVRALGEVRGPEVLAGPEGGGGAVADADLAEDVADVNLDGALADAEPTGDTTLIGYGRFTRH